MKSAVIKYQMAVECRKKQTCVKNVPNKSIKQSICSNETLILLNYIWQAKAETFQDPKIKIKLFKALIGCEF